MEFDRSDRPASNVFPELGTGMALGVALNTVALVFCVTLTLGPSLLHGVSSSGFVDWLVIPTILAGYWAMGFSVVQVVYLGPLALLALLRGRRPLALGLVIAMAVTFLLQTLCIGAGTAFFVWAMSQPGAMH
jgi:hypothetical protein